MLKVLPELSLKRYQSQVQPLDFPQKDLLSFSRYYCSPTTAE